MKINTDKLKTIDDLENEIRLFVSKRNWGKYHDPKNLSMSIAIEASELMENFQWITNAESELIIKTKIKKQRVIEELADVIIYCLMLSYILKIDLSSAIIKKIKKNSKKYPTKKFKNNYFRTK